MPKKEQLKSLEKSIAMSHLSIAGSNDKKIKELELGEEVDIIITGARVKSLRELDRFDIEDGKMTKDDIIVNLEFPDEQVTIK